MAQLFGAVFEGLANSLLRGSQGAPPGKVLEVKPESYSRQSVVDREDCLTLYGPFQDIFDVVLQVPFQRSTHTVYSLYRSKDVSESKDRFVIFKEIIPLLLECKKEYCNRNSMQIVCDLLWEHQTWTATHVAAHLGITECFDHPEVKKDVNTPCIVSGKSPLHIAVASEKVKTVQALLDIGATLDVIDVDGNTVFHAAASTSKEIIQLLSSKSSDLINFRNNLAQTALHIACVADKPECVKALILAGADVNATGTCGFVETPVTGSARGVLEMYPRHLNAKDMKHGGTPLHWATSKEVVEALIDLGCTIDARDFNGDTALHTMVLRSRFQCVVALLCGGADVNVGNEQLETPLHMACKVGNIGIVQALVVFGAEVNAVNKSGDLPRHILCTTMPKSYANILHILHSVGARRCEYKKVDCKDGCVIEGKFDGTPLKPASQPYARHLFDEMIAAATVTASLARRRRSDAVDGKAYQKAYRVLSLDGGGIRGLVIIQILIVIESILGQPLTKCFDWIAGTSTGGILALLVALGRSPRYCQRMYFRLKNKVFNGLRPYDSKPLEAILQTEFGENTVMSDIKYPKVAVTGVLADRHPAELHIFRNYESPQSLLGMFVDSPFTPPPRFDEQLMWRAARASGAAPTYFCAMGRFVDGGLISNNPTLDILTEIHEYNCAMKATGHEHKVRHIDCIVSLGTGKPPVVPINSIDVFCPESAWDAAKMAFGISNLGNLLIDQATSSDGRVVDRARAWCSMINVPYIRFNPDISENVNLDETKDEILIQMLCDTMLFMYSKKKELFDLKELLLRDAS